jgi:hypothetical protein
MRGLTPLLQKAVVKLADAAAAPPAKLRLHILCKPGSGGSQLKSALDTYIDGVPEWQGRFTVEVTDFEL